ncbi:hypothetical protein ABPG72_017764 [Tetrahymena utriculariae]
MPQQQSIIFQYQKTQVIVDSPQYGHFYLSDLASDIPNFTNAQEFKINLYCNLFGDGLTTDLGRRILKFTNLTTLNLDLTSDKMTYYGIIVIGSQLSKFANLSNMSLRLGWKETSHHSVSVLCSALSRCQKLSTFAFIEYVNQTINRQFSQFLFGLSQLSHLSTFELKYQFSNNGDQAAQDILNGLVKFSNLSTLSVDLSTNKITDQGASDISLGLDFRKFFAPIMNLVFSGIASYINSHDNLSINQLTKKDVSAKNAEIIVNQSNENQIKIIKTQFQNKNIEYENSLAKQSNQGKLTFNLICYGYTINQILLDIIQFTGVQNIQNQIKIFKTANGTYACSFNQFFAQKISKQLTDSQLGPVMLIKDTDSFNLKLFINCNYDASSQQINGLNLVNSIWIQTLKTDIYILPNGNIYLNPVDSMMVVNICSTISQIDMYQKSNILAAQLSQPYSFFLSFSKSEEFEIGAISSSDLIYNWQTLLKEKKTQSSQDMELPNLRQLNFTHVFIKQLFIISYQPYRSSLNTTYIIQSSVQSTYDQYQPLILSKSSKVANISHLQL